MDCGRQNCWVKIELLSDNKIRNPFNYCGLQIGTE